MFIKKFFKNKGLTGYSTSLESVMRPLGKPSIPHLLPPGKPALQKKKQGPLFSSGPYGSASGVSVSLSACQVQSWLEVSTLARFFFFSVFYFIFEDIGGKSCLATIVQLVQL